MWQFLYYFELFYAVQALIKVADSAGFTVCMILVHTNAISVSILWH